MYFPKKNQRVWLWVGGRLAKRQGVGVLWRGSLSLRHVQKIPLSGIYKKNTSSLRHVKNLSLMHTQKTSLSLSPRHTQKSFLSSSLRHSQENRLSPRYKPIFSFFLIYIFPFYLSLLCTYIMEKISRKKVL